MERALISFAGSFPGYRPHGADKREINPLKAAIPDKTQPTIVSAILFHSQANPRSIAGNVASRLAQPHAEQHRGMVHLTYLFALQHTITSNRHL